MHNLRLWRAADGSGSQAKLWAWRVRQRAKIEALTHYGNGRAACVRCGIDDLDVLTLDHIDNDGHKTRLSVNRSLRTGDTRYGVLRSKGWPSGLQTLCANCNLKKERVRTRAKMGIENGH